MRFRVRMLVVLTCPALFATQAFQAAAFASNFSATLCDPNATPVTCVNLTNNRGYTVQFIYGENTITGLSASVGNVVQNAYNVPTNLHATVDPTDSTPDVYLVAYDYGKNGVFAWTECDMNAASVDTGGGTGVNRWCRGQTVRFNSNYSYAGVFSTTNRRNNVACHELAHTIGLRHPQLYEGSVNEYNQSCVYQRPYDDGAPAVLSSHDIGHVNATYPSAATCAANPGAPRC